MPEEAAICCGPCKGPGEMCPASRRAGSLLGVKSMYLICNFKLTNEDER